ncbi:TRAP transporter small permease [Hoeflea sp. CAU 1731]
MTDPDHQAGRTMRILHWIASLALCVMMLVVVGDVILRAVFNTPIQGAYDVVSISLLVMTVFGIAPVVAGRREIMIDLIDGFVSNTTIRVLAVIAALTGGMAFLFLGWAMITPALDAWRWGERSLELGMPKWPLWVVAFLGLVGILWAYLIQLRSNLRGAQDSAPGEDKS